SYGPSVSLYTIHHVSRSISRRILNHLTYRILLRFGNLPNLPRSIIPLHPPQIESHNPIYPPLPLLPPLHPSPSRPPHRPSRPISPIHNRPPLQHRNILRHRITPPSPIHIPSSPPRNRKHRRFQSHASPITLRNPQEYPRTSQSPHRK